MKGIYVALCCGILCLLSCNSTSKNQDPTYTPAAQAKKETVKKPGYYCPMECEGDKTYADADTTRHCPDCGMELVHTK